MKGNHLKRKAPKEDLSPRGEKKKHKKSKHRTHGNHVREVVGSEEYCLEKEDISQECILTKISKRKQNVEDIAGDLDFKNTKSKKRSRGDMKARRENEEVIEEEESKRGTGVLICKLKDQEESRSDSDSRLVKSKHKRDKVKKRKIKSDLQNKYAASIETCHQVLTQEGTDKCEKKKKKKSENVFIAVEEPTSSEEKEDASHCEERKKKKGKKEKKKKTKDKDDCNDDAVDELKESECCHPALLYLQQWKMDRGCWRFQKVRQTWLLQNMFNKQKVR